ncbi:hypothetical protein HHK36_002082 [Tetracentron sinense]|uniref:Late embryogenesis abundant protein LEA-2 subgroup domain-containing protein n=1 Tax=Tetracentron sinense TaxID=13715 RepID=A0A834ZZ76_TETSI|nr:hypothetical protein HHK36_002082 [Tetracentron sinense]
MSGSTSCCRFCTSTILTLGLISLFMWLSLRPKEPTYSIEDFYVPALNKTLNSTRNTTISIHLKLSNGNKNSGIYYDALNISLFYGRNRSVAVGNFSINGFYQGHKKNAHRIENVKTEGVPWESALKELSNATVIFRLDLATAVRYKIMASKTKRHKMTVGGEVEVDEGGKKAKKKGLKLKSEAPARVSYRTSSYLSDSKSNAVEKSSDCKNKIYCSPAKLEENIQNLLKMTLVLLESHGRMSTIEIGGNIFDNSKELDRVRKAQEDVLMEINKMLPSSEFLQPMAN